MGLSVANTSTNTLTSGLLRQLAKQEPITSDMTVSGNTLNVARSITSNNVSAPTVQNQATTQYTAGNLSPHTFSHTVTTQTNQVLVIGIASTSTSAPTSVTYAVYQ